MISNPTPVQRPQQQNNQQRPDAPRRQFTRINMPLSQALQHLLKEDLVMLRDPHPNPNIASPKYNLNVKCAYHSNSFGHDTNNCWALKTKIYDLTKWLSLTLQKPIMSLLLPCLVIVKVSMLLTKPPSSPPLMI